MKKLYMGRMGTEFPMVVFAENKNEARNLMISNAEREFRNNFYDDFEIALEPYEVKNENILKAEGWDDGTPYGDLSDFDKDMTCRDIFRKIQKDIKKIIEESSCYEELFDSEDVLKLRNEAKIDEKLVDKINQKKDWLT